MGANASLPPFGGTDLQTLATALAAIAALAQAIAAVIMVRGLKHSRESVRIAADALGHAQDTSRSQLRAYLDRADGRFTGFKAKDASTCTFVVRNFGQTPARITATELNAAIVPRTGDGQRAFYALDGVRVDSTTIAAGADGVFHAQLTPAEWQPHLVGLTQATHVAMFRLRLKYEDIFDVEHALDIVTASRGLFTEFAPTNMELVRRVGD